MAEQIRVRFERPEGEVRKWLDGRLYAFRFRWNTREQVWVVSIFTAEGDPIVQGLAVVPGVNLLRQVVSADAPPGALVAVDTRGTGQRAGRDDLVRNVVVLVYLTAEEVANAA